MILGLTLVAYLVTVGGSDDQLDPYTAKTDSPPEGQVGEGAQPSGSLDRLVGRSVLTKTDRVVGGDLKDAKVGQGRQTDGTGSVRHKVEEGGAEGDETTVCGETVADGSHAVLTDTEAEVSARVVSETGRGVLEVGSALVPGQVGASQVGRTTDELGENLGQRVEGRLGELSGSDGGVRGGVGGQSLFPAFRKTALDTTSEFGGLLGVLLLVRLEEGVPLLLELVTLGGELLVVVGGLLGNDERLGRVEAKLLLELFNVVLLEG